MSANGPPAVDGEMAAASSYRAVAPKEPLRGSLVVLEVEAAPDHLRRVHEILDTAAHRLMDTTSVKLLDTERCARHDDV